MKFICVFCILLVIFEQFNLIQSIDDASKKVKIKGKTKTIIDLDDADVERLYDEWEVKNNKIIILLCFKSFKSINNKGQ